MRCPLPQAPALALVLLVAHGPVASLCAEAVRTVAQRDRAFSVREVALDRGDKLRFTNEDEFPHQIYAQGPGVTVNSGLQQPGETLDVLFPDVGTVEVRCGVHPRMRLTVQVR